jgi:putative ATP-grasp target RiPP
MSRTIHAIASEPRDDPLYPVAGQLPLGRRLGCLPADDAASPTAALKRPFALRFATVPPRSVPVELTDLRYDPVRQVSVDGAGTPVYGKHSTGRTGSRISDGHRLVDSDTDHTED